MRLGLLQKEEPGNPLPDVAPGFTDELMRRIADYRRRQRRRRIATRLLVTVAVVSAAYLFAMRRIDDMPKYDIVQRHPGQPGRAATPALNAGPVQQPGSSRDTVKLETSVRAPVVERAAGGRKEPTPAVKRAPLQQQASSP